MPTHQGNGQKKINGHTYYFGPWSDPQAAREKYERRKGNPQSDADHDSNDGLTVRRLVNSFLNSKRRLLESGEIKQSTFQDYYDNCKRVLKVFGRNRLVSSLRPIDFEKLRADFARTHLCARQRWQSASPWQSW
jgi:hypothetical protein